MPTTAPTVKTALAWMAVLILPCLVAGAQETVFMSSFETRTVTIQFIFDETVTDNRGEQVAAAFHDLAPIDLDGRRLFITDFATEAGHAFQVDGWYGNQPDDEVGLVQWAARTATLSIPLPKHAEGILFTVLGAMNGQMAEVTVDGVPTTPLRVDDYWHEAYVPIVNPIPEALPEPVITWHEDRYFPEFPDSDRFFSIRVRTDLLNWSYARAENFRIDQSYLTTMALTLVGMQGVINRHRPRVYLRWDTFNDIHGNLLESLEPQAEVIHLELDPMSAFHFLWRKYGSLFEGAVIYDPGIPNTINLATMLAGLENRLILGPSQPDYPGMPIISNTKDLAAQAPAEGWDNTEAGQYRLYQWVYDNLWPTMERRILGVISPGPPIAGKGSPEHWYPLALSERDYYVALNIAALHIDPAFDPDQEALWLAFLAESESPIPVTGVFRNNETKIVETAAEHGNWMAGLSWPGHEVTMGNLSVFSGVRPPVEPAPSRFDPDRIMAALSATVVTTNWAPDGDPLAGQVDFSTHYDLLRNQRLGYTVEPWFMDIAPALWNFYTGKEPDDQVSFLAGFSGNGYAWPMRMTDQQLDAYLDKVLPGLRRSGLRVVYFDDEGWPYSEREPRRYHEELAPVGYLGTLLASLAFNDETRVRYAGVPAPQIKLEEVIWWDPSNEDEIIDRLFDKPLMGNYQREFESWHTQAGEEVTDPDASEGRALRIPDDFGSHPSCCFAAALNPLSIPPGEYTATFRAKVPDNSVMDPVITFSILDQGNGGPDAINEHLNRAPSDFISSGIYQEFSINFSNDHLAQNVDVVFQYEGGAGDVYIDNFRLERSGDPIVPFHSARLGAGYATPAAPDFGVSGRFADKFESRGGVFLHPEEFVASLNPEFMLDFARERLPANDPLLAEAETELAMGHFFDAVLKVRQALLASQAAQ